MKTFFTFFLALFFFDFAIAQTANVNDSLALVYLYDSTNGANWIHSNGWLTSRPVSEWFGVVSDTNGRVTSLLLFDNNLTGVLPASIGNLSNLNSLYFDGDNITGVLPSSIGKLSLLQTLSIFQNKLTGSLPVEIGNLTSLTYLQLSNNQLSGALPATIGNLKFLTNLELEYNNFSDTLPSSLGNLVSLIELELSHNQFTGNIPDSLGNLSSLTALYLERNQLSGNIPASLGKLSSLFDMRLRDNHLTGTIPSEIGNIPKLHSFQVYRNQLSGPLPLSLANLSNLTDVEFSQNKFVFDEVMEKLSLNTGYVDYAPQATVPLHSVGAMQFVVFAADQSAPGDSSLKHDTVYWYKNFTLDHITIADTFTTFNNIATGDTVFAVVRNSIATSLTLYSDTVVYTGVLAASLINFTAVPKGDDVLLSWQTANVDNMSHFNIQRSTDGETFTTITNQTAAGNTISKQSYSYTDPNVVSSLHSSVIYYRLQTVNNDGTTSLSSIQTVNLKVLVSVLVTWPNPVQDVLHIKLRNTIGKSSVEIYNTTGRQLIQKSIEIENGKQFNFNVSALTAGTYFIVVKRGDKKFQAVFLKQ